MSEAFRIERDPIGDKRVRADALYGVQTARALENFHISGYRIHPQFITAIAEIKKAAAQTNLALGSLDRARAEPIIAAADEVIAGQWREHFRLDVFQAGAGTSYNMNVNEVVANRALEMTGARRGDYDRINPNDHVNKSQSSNDVIPTAIRITTYRLGSALLDALRQCGEAFLAKGREFNDVVKPGRTHLHDATPMTLGEEFSAYGRNVHRASGTLRFALDQLLEVPLGGTAVGNGVNTKSEYASKAVAALAVITGLPLTEAADKVQLQQSVGDFVAVSGAVRLIAVELSKIASDLRLLNSGPHTAIAEIELPALQPGSSIMPGKVNPAVAEMLNMACFHAIGRDAAIGICGEAGQLEVNVMMPYVAFGLFEMIDIMTRAVTTFTDKCVTLVEADRIRCRELCERSVGLAALHNDELGFMGAAELAKQAMDTGRTIDDLLDEHRGRPKNAAS
ncbi:MAG TPA: aspartate ammonia-lyase [Vicinamibacterales bacterium]|nr:aspartate ammonia-lyase [Vicinamibacterales bacterium]